MKPADDPGKEYKALVRQGYDACAAAYDRARRDTVHPELVWITERLEAGARVLDIGCGAGVPITRALARRFRVTGVDLSPEMIRRARSHVPVATFIAADMMTVTLPPASFDAVVSFYAIFHLPREEHAALFARIYGWLKPGGLLLATVAEVGEHPYIEDDFFGVSMYWSHYGWAAYRAMLAETGFEVLATGAVGHGYGETYAASEEQHPLVFAQKPAVSGEKARA